MNLLNFTINDFLGIIFIFGFYIWFFGIVFNGLSLIKDYFLKK